MHRSSPSTLPRLTLFGIPKPFVGEADWIQRNAVESWRRLGDRVEVVLLGDDAGVAETSVELGVRHLGGLAVNEHGTPLLGSAWRRVQENSSGEILIYCNCDVILLPELVEALDRLSVTPEWDGFVAIGRRTDLRLTGPLDWEDADPRTDLRERAAREGTPGPVVCKEFFAFPRATFPEIPEFAVGRGNWDNWMVADARRRSIPVVRIDQVAPIIHQTHDYAHLRRGNRRAAYVTGAEARENERLGGGKHLVAGSSATWELSAADLRRKRGGAWCSDFWLDLPRFLRLLGDLMAR